MTVNFSVVGIFYSTTVDLSQIKGNTVGDIIDYLFRSDPDFYYTSMNANGNVIVSSFSQYHPIPFTGRTGIAYPAGFYQIAQTFTDPAPNPYSVWQYYLTDETGVRRPAPGDLSYTQATVQDGWSVVWRLVTICNEPTGLAKRLRKLLPPDLQASVGVA